MSIRFDKLNRLLEDKGYTTYKIRKDNLMGQATLHKIQTGTGIVDTRTIDRLCAALDCQPADIMEYVPDNNQE